MLLACFVPDQLQPGHDIHSTPCSLDSRKLIGEVGISLLAPSTKLTSGLDPAALVVFQHSTENPQACRRDTGSLASVQASDLYIISSRVVRHRPPGCRDPLRHALQSQF